MTPNSLGWIMMILAAAAYVVAALILLSAKIEQQMRSRSEDANLPRETTLAFRDFLAVRNKVAHKAVFEVKDATILTLISIGIELLKIVSAKKHGAT